MGLPQNNQPDSYFIAETRRILRDQPVWFSTPQQADGTTGEISVAGSTLFRLTRAPVLRTSVFLTAPALSGAGFPGFASWNPIFDAPPPIFNPAVLPVIADGGVGVLAGGTYQVIYTFVVGGVEEGMSLPSNVLTLAASRKLQVNAMSGLPSTVTAINVYLILSPAANVGFLGQIAVTAGATIATQFNAGGTGVLPAMVISDTGELAFCQAPPAGSVAIQYQAVRYSDQQITDALYDGLNLLWPEIWNPAPFDTTSILPSPIQWEYNLPSAFQDQRAVMLDVEIMPPSAFVIFTRVSGWRIMNDINTPKLIFDRPPPPGGVVRLTYAIPFVSLGTVPVIVQNLPVYYAIAKLLADQEVMRGRSDDLPALTGENAGAEKGGAMQTSAYWLDLFEKQLVKFELDLPARRSVMYRAVERLNLSSVWRGAA